MHIVQRGPNNEPCYYCEDDYACDAFWLKRALERAKRALHAQVPLMNCGHWLVTPKQAAMVQTLWESSVRLRALSKAVWRYEVPCQPACYAQLPHIIAFAPA